MTPRNPWAALGYLILLIGGGLAWGATVAYLYARRWT
jgi:hypothetical protein